MASLKNTPTLPDKLHDDDWLDKHIKPLTKQLGDLQDLLYAGKSKAVLIILQGLDASGKDNTINKVLSEVNHSGCQVKGFKAPTEEEKAHDFLWRIHKNCPERGMIQIFNRSHYEDVLVPVVNEVITKGDLQDRYKAINQFEQMLIDNGTTIFKFFLHVGAEEQHKRIEARLEDPAKRYKFNPNDLDVFDVRKKYLKQYDQVFEHCNQAAEWHIIPADHKPHKNLQILKVLVKGMEKIV